MEVVETEIITALKYISKKCNKLSKMKQGFINQNQQDISACLTHKRKIIIDFYIPYCDVFLSDVLTRKNETMKEKLYTETPF